MGKLKMKSHWLPSLLKLLQKLKTMCLLKLLSHWSLLPQYLRRGGLREHRAAKRKSWRDVARDKTLFSSTITYLGEIQTGLVKFCNPLTKPFPGVAWESRCQNPHTAPFQPAVAPALLPQAGHQHSRL